MKLFHLEIHLDTLKDKWDVVFEQIVRASDSSEARCLATVECQDEGPDVWLNADTSSCVELSAEGRMGVIMKRVRIG